jgi:hypothetical protein
MEDKKFTIDEETALSEFESFCEAWEIDFDESTMNEDEKADFSRLKNQIMKAIKRGRLCLNEDETLSYTISKTKNPNKNGKQLKISRPEGDAYLSMDQYKDGQGVHKFNAILARMTGHAVAYFNDFDGIDLKPLQAIVSLFLAE